MTIDLAPIIQTGVVGAFLLLLMFGKWIRLEREVTNEEKAHAETKKDRDEWKLIARQYEAKWSNEVLPLLRSTSSAIERMAAEKTTGQQA